MELNGRNSIKSRIDRSERLNGIIDPANLAVELLIVEPSVAVSRNSSGRTVKIVAAVAVVAATVEQSV